MRVRTNLILRELGGDFMIVDPSQGKVDMSQVFKLNHTAADIFNHFQGKEIDAQLVKEYILDHYDISEEIAETDCHKIIADFLKNGLLHDR